MKNNFQQNIELDAQMVLAAMKGGIHGLMALGMKLRHIFTTTKMVTDRAEWLKEQGEDYITKVSVRAAELEKKK